MKARNSDVFRSVGLCLGLVFLFGGGPGAAAENEGLAPGDGAAKILEEAGVAGGLMIHLGCGDGRLTAALGAPDGWVVQGLDTDPANVAAARSRLKSAGVYGKVSARRFDGRRLPYIEGLVNLIVVSDPLSVEKDELLRVLCPGGVAIRLPADTGLRGIERLVKPWPEKMDDWTHYRHDASGNAVSHDTRVGPPRHLQWTARPRWARSHEHAASVTTMVSGQGKLFYIEDEGARGILVPDLPERWALCARDAFSGILLWKKKFSDWGSTVWGGVWHCREPMTLPRRLVVAGGKVFVTLGFRETGISVLDPDTGKVLNTFQSGKNNDELICHDGVLLVRQRKSIPDYPLGPGSSKAVLAKARKDKTPDIPPASMGDETILALDAETGEALWKHREKRIVALSLAALGDRVCYHNLEQIVCLDLRRGRELWRAECPTWPDITGVGGTLVMYEDKVVHAGDRGIMVFSAETGERLWRGPGLHRMSVRHPPDMFIIQGTIWGGPMPQIAGCRGYPQLHRTPFAAPLVSGETVKGVDLGTGKVAREVEVGGLLSPGHHVRCYPSKATERFLIWPKRGMEFVDVAEGEHHERVDWARGECGYGVMPSYGLIYLPPHPCICYLGVLLDGFNAVGPAKSPAKTPEEQPQPDSENQLERGPAYGKASELESASGDLQSDWPMYRHDPRRSGAAASAVPADLRARWTADIEGRLTQPVIAGGTVYVVSIDTHTIHAVSADRGEELWQYTADGRVDSPPAVHGGLLLFGCTDGKVYCLRASDGTLAWRFQAAPSEADCVVRGQVESRWPVHGSVLVQNGLVYCSAGRSSFLDGGLYLYALDPQSGEIRHKGRLSGPWFDPDEKPAAPYHMEGAKSDVLVGQEDRVFLGFNAFDRHLERLPGQPFAERGSRKVQPHLMSTTGLLDDSWWDRGRWTYGAQWPGRHYRANAPCSGQILCFGEGTIYTLNAFPGQGPMSPRFIPGREGYSLAAYRRDPEGSAGAEGRRRGENVKDELIRWKQRVPIRARGMVLAKDTLLLAGAPDVLPEDDPYAALEGRRGARLRAVSAADGTKLFQLELAAPPVFDGMAAAAGKLYLSATDGKLICFAGSEP